MQEGGDWPSTGKLGGTFLWERIINGPVRSRRLGLSLGLNIIPPRSKLCSFDCPYCECGFNTPRAAGARWPSPDIVGDALRKTFTLGGVRPDWVTFAGNGEPTMHPRFAVVVDRVLAVRDEIAPGVKVGILSNGMHLGSESVRSALDRLDARMIKLDPGPPERVNGRAVDRATLVAGIRRLRDVTVQAMVVEGEGWSGASDAEVEVWLAALAAARPLAVQLYSLDRAPADPAVRGVPHDRLEQIAERARRALGVEVTVF